MTLLIITTGSSM